MLALEFVVLGDGVPAERQPLCALPDITEDSVTVGHDNLELLYAKRHQFVHTV